MKHLLSILEAFQIKCRVNTETHIQQQTVQKGVECLPSDGTWNLISLADWIG